MKPKPRVTRFHRKYCKAHFTTHSSIRSVLLSMPLSLELHRKDDKVQVVCSTFKGREVKVVQVYRCHWVIHIEWITKEKVNGSTVPINIHPSKVVITKLGTTTVRKP